jgi:hypothetical protein
MEIDLDKLDSYLNDHYLDIEDNIYLFFRWILNNRDYIISFNKKLSLTLMFMKSYQEFENLNLENNEFGFF